MPDYHTFWINLLIEVLTGNLLLLPSENVNFQLFSFHHKNTQAISITTGQVTGLSLEGTAVNHLRNTLPNCAKLGSFSVGCLKIPSHFHLMP